MKTRARNILLSITFPCSLLQSFNIAPVNAQDDAFEPYEWDLTELYPVWKPGKLNASASCSRLTISKISAAHWAMMRILFMPHCVLSPISTGKYYGCIPMPAWNRMKIFGSPMPRNAISWEKACLPVLLRPLPGWIPNSLPVGEERINSFLEDNEDLAPFALALKTPSVRANIPSVMKPNRRCPIFPSLLMRPPIFILSLPTPTSRFQPSPCLPGTRQ